MEKSGQVLAAKFQAIFPHLDERQRRLLTGAEARALGHGGIRAVARAAGVREDTVSLGVDELDAGAEPLDRARRPGGGRKRAADLDPGLRPALLALVEPERCPGVTSRCIRSVLGRKRISATSTARSAQSSRGRGWVRRSAATSCRSTSSSMSLDAVERPSRTSQPQSRTMMR
jgi:hypothetical protein